MPLLRRQPFIKEPVPADIDPDEEVFHCKPTGEIFREYEQFFERVIVCNSLVWSCSLTGKPNLTYEEAVASEKKAMKHVQSFPQGLRCPVLLLALLTHRSRINDMSDDVYSYIKCRFFMGEEVELAMGTDKRPCKVLKVIPTTSSNLSNGHASHASDSDDPERAKDVTAAFYKYTVEVTDGSRNVEEASPDHLSRPKRLVNRDKLKLFLKVHSEPVNGIWKVKDEFVNQYNLAAIKYSFFFPSPLPVFAVSAAKKYKRQPKEEHMAPDSAAAADDRAEESRGPYDYNRYSPASVTPNRLRLTPEEKAFLKDKQRQEKIAEKMERKEKIAEVRAKLKEEKGKARRKLKEQKRLEAEVMKEWSKPRDDLECDDLRPLPCPRPVATRMQNELFGDVIEVLEFFECFGDVVGLRDRFPQGITLDTMEKALLETDMNGPLTDLLAVFLTAIFSCQDQEDEDVLMEAAVSADGQILDTMDDAEDIDNASGALSHKELMGSAVTAAQVPQLCHGRSLKEFPLDAFTVTEVLRLHFAASGARCNAASAKFRYQQRGGFMSLDDGGMELRRHDSDALLKTLSASNVFDLPPEVKLKIIAALVTQLLSYSSYRDIVEDELDSLKQARTELRQLQWAEQRREKEKASARYRKRRELKAKEGKVERRRGRKANSSMNRSDGGDGLPNQADEPMELSNGQQQSTPIVPPKDDAASKKEARRLANKLLKDSAKREAAAVAALSTDGRTRRKAAFEDSLDVTEFFDVDWDVVIACAANEEEKATLLVRREEVETKRKEAFLEKEREMMERAQRLGYKCGTHPLGRDRCYRRFWLFHSVPGLYVEQCDDTVPAEFAAAYQRLRLADVQPSSDAGKASSEPGGGLAECCADGGAGAVASGGGSASSKSGSGGDLKPALLGGELKGDDGQAMIAFMTPELLPVQESRWMCFGSEDDLDKVIEALNERGFRESALKQALIDARPLLQQSLQKAHGDESAPASTAAASERSDGAAKGQAQPAAGRSRKSGRQQAATPVAPSGKGRGSLALAGSASQRAQDALELSLREALLDLEERIYAGVLGAIKVSDRLMWRQCVERGTVPTGSYTSDGIACSGAEDGATAFDGACEAGSGDLRSPVRGLAQALLDIQKGIDAKYLCQPLGDASHDGKPTASRAQAKQQKVLAAAAAVQSSAGFGAVGLAPAEDVLLPSGGTPDGDAHKTGSTPAASIAPAKALLTTLERWQDSLLSSTSLSQVFLHFSTLEKAIQWSKSALNARCALCRRKGDGEKMLLCDGCDRGHHMYCLKPPVKEVPEGDWFCPECRPKQARPSSRRAKRQAFGQDEESFAERASAGPSSASSSSAEDDDDEDDDDDDEEEKDDAETSRQLDEDEAAPEEAAAAPPAGRDSPAECVTATATRKEKAAKARSKQRSRAKAADARSSSPCGGSHVSDPVAKRSSGAAAPRDDGSSKAKKPRTGTPTTAATSGSTASTAGSSAAGISAATMSAGATGTATPAKQRGGRVDAKASDSGRRQRRRDAARHSPADAAAAEDDDAEEVEQQEQAIPHKQQRQRKSDGGVAAAAVEPRGGNGRRSSRGADQQPAPASQSTAAKTRHRGSDAHTPARESAAAEAGDAMQRCEELLSVLMKHDDAWPFLRPVNRREVPDYHTIIKHPMDFSTIKSKINLISYTDVQEVIRDIRLVFENCQTYNFETSEVYKSGEKLSKLFESKLKSLNIEAAAPVVKRARCS